MDQLYTLAIDQGTTGTTVLIQDVTDPLKPVIIGRCTIDFKQYYPKPGWVAHDLDEIWATVAKATSGAMAAAKTAKPAFASKKIIAIGITNQRETLCVFHRKTSRPTNKAIVWQCKRSLDICNELKNQNLEAMFKKKTGLVLDPYFSGSKMTWVMENDVDTAAKLRQGTAVWGTIDTYLLHRLTGGKVFATEPSNASRTLAFNIESGVFDPELAEILKIPSLSSLPEVKDSAGIFGKTQGLDFLPDGIPITGILGDQQAALAGQTCFNVGDAKCTYGTGAFLLLNTGESLAYSNSGLLTTIGWRLSGKTNYVFEGACFIAGAAIQFLRDQLHLIDNAQSTEDLASNCIGAPEVYFVPALSGLGAPHWQPEARGSFFGLTRGTTKGQLIRATLEGIAFQVDELITAMNQDAPVKLNQLFVDGGAAANDLLMQFQSNISALDVDRPSNLESTAQGAAIIAGLGVGLYSDIKDLKKVRKSARIFNSDSSEQGRALSLKQKQGWQRAIRAVKVFSG